MSPYLALPCRSLEEVLNYRGMTRTEFLNEDGHGRPMSSDDRDACASAATMIGALHAQLAGWRIDALGDCLHYLDQAEACAKLASRGEG